jgi:hypothetical protein
MVTRKDGKQGKPIDARRCDQETPAAVNCIVSTAVHGIENKTRAE